LGGILKKSYKVIVAIAAASLVTSVAVAPANAAGAKQKVCVALDTGGINDKSFNQTSYAGATASKTKGWASSVEYLPAASSSEYGPNIKKFVDKKCTYIIGIGFAVADAIIASAEANPSIKYAIVDHDGLKNFSTKIPNVKGLTFNTNENSFLAGYLAAGYSKSNVVATYGGAPYPTVTIFMDGFAKGVAYYNDIHGKSVKVLGWDPAKPSAGTMVGDFSSTNKALSISQNFELQGADVIFPVAGGLGATTADNSLKSGKSVTIGVDADFHLTAPQYDKVILISVLKGLSESVQAAVKEAYDGKFSNALYVGTLKNKGVGLSPLYSPMKASISPKLLSELNDLQTNVAGGYISAK
jgi:basic membrane protein A